MNKTIRECKDEISKKYGFNYWYNEIASEKLIDEAMELYSQQFQHAECEITEKDFKDILDDQLEGGLGYTEGSVHGKYNASKKCFELAKTYAKQLLAHQNEAKFTEKDLYRAIQNDRMELRQLGCFQSAQLPKIKVNTSPINV